VGIGKGGRFFVGKRKGGVGRKFWMETRHRGRGRVREKETAVELQRKCTGEVGGGDIEVRMTSQRAG